MKVKIKRSSAKFFLRSRMWEVELPLLPRGSSFIYED